MKTIEIPVREATAQATRLVATLEGVTPVLHHRPNLAVSDGTTKKVNEKKIPTPEEEARLGAYQRADGTLYAPATWIHRNLIEAGKAFQNPQNRKATMKTVIAAGVIMPPVDGFTFYDGDGEPMTEYEIDTRRAVVMRAAIMRSRPLIPTPWTLNVEFEVDVQVFTGRLAEDLPDSTMLELGGAFASYFEQGGSKLGIGDYRPEKTGPFGRYKVSQLSLVRDDG